MIIDDDLQIREGIQEGIDWESLGIDEVRSYGNALNALGELERFSPDIILSDVRMPGMDGLSFLKQVKKQRPEVKFIMISAYSDFEYVKKALEHGALDYELKPLKFRKLITLISKTVKLIKAECAEAERRGEHLAHYQRDLLRKVFIDEQPIDIETLKIFEQKIHLSDEYTHHCLVLKLVCDARITEELITQRLLPAFPQLLRFHLYLEAERQLILILKNPCPGTSDAERRLRSLIRDLDRESPIEGLQLSGGISTIHTLEDIPSAYRHACGLMGHTSYLGRGTLMMKKDLHRTGAAVKIDLAAAQETVADSFMKFDKLQMEKGIAQIGEYFSAARETRLNLIRKALIECCILIMHRKGQSSLFDIEWTSKALSALFYHDDMIGFLQNLLSVLLKAEEERETAHLSSMTIGALEYIHKHYRENITAGDVAAAISKSPNYFSSVFKKDLSVSFKEYVNRLRIKEAERLIREGHEYIYEVADQVGFSDYTYFYQVFKRITGYEPTKLKKG